MKNSTAVSIAKKSVSAIGLTVLMAGCATDKPLLQQVSDTATSARRAAADFIAPSAPASAASAPAAAAPAETTKKVGVVFDKAYNGKVTGNAVTTGVRTAATPFVSLDKQYAQVTIRDAKTGSKIEPVSYTAIILTPSCSPTVAGTLASTATAVGNNLLNRFGGAAAQAGGNALPGGGGAVGNVLRTQTQRGATQAGNDAKTQILSGATNLTEAQQKACKEEIGTAATELKTETSKFVATFEKENKGVKAVATTTGSADLKDLGVTAAPTRAPTRAP